MKLINRAIVAPIAFGIVTIGSAWAEVIPAERRIDWGPETVGVPGGIPDRQVIFADVTRPPYNADKTGVQSATAAIQSAINTCPQNQVVYIPAGTYKITSSLNFGTRTHVTLRGAGMGKTILKSTGASAISSGFAALSSQRTVTSGSTKGSTSMVASDVGGVSVGSLLTITQENDPELIWSRHGTPDLMKQRAVVTAVNGSTIGFSPPLAFDFDRNPRYQYNTNVNMRFNGVEDLTIDGTAINTYNVWFDHAYGCWIKNVESTYAGNVHFFFSNCLRVEVRGCYAHHTTSSNDGFGIEAYSNCTGLLIEDNIFAEMWLGVMLNQTVGSVVAYNYGGNFNRANTDFQTTAYNANHGAHGIMTLWEGNVGQQWQNDGYHGSTSHQTIFRNWLHGLHDRTEHNRKMVDLTRFSYYHNVVGNILGSPGWNPTGYEMTGSPTFEVARVIYRLGYPNMGNNFITDGNPPEGIGGDFGGHDPKVKQTMLRHGNYDYFNDAIVWDPEITERTLPDSLYLPARPSWFDADLDWPPFDPANPGAASATSIPAGRRYLAGGGAVELYGVFEEEVTNAEPYNNKFDYSEIGLRVSVTPPGGSPIGFFGFHAGDGSGGQSGDVWKFRFMPTTTGVHSYTYSWEGSGAKPAGGSGSFTVVDNGTYRGKLRIDGQNSWYFQDSRGNPFHARPYGMTDADHYYHAANSNVMYGSNGANSMAYNYNQTIDAAKARGFNMVYLFNGRPALAGANPPWSDNGFWLNKQTDVFNVAVWDDIEAIARHAHRENMYVWWQATLANVHDSASWSKVTDNMKKYWVARFAPLYNTMGYSVTLEWNHGWSATVVDDHMTDLHDYDPFGTLLDVHSLTGVSDVFGNWLGFTSRQYHPASWTMFKVNDRSGGGTVYSSFQDQPVFGAEDLWEGYFPSPNGATEMRRGAWSEMMAGVIPVPNEWLVEASAYYASHQLGSLPGTEEMIRMFDFWYANVDYRDPGFRQLNSLVSEAAGQIASGVPGSQYVVYDQSGGDITIDLSGAPGSFEVLWYDPKSGQQQAAGTVNGGSPATIASPYTGDSALLLTREGLQANRAPTASDRSLVTNVNTGLNVLLGASDPDGDPLQFSIVSQPAHGTLSGTAPNLVYAPTAGYVGGDSFSFKASDGALESNVATVSIVIHATGGQEVAVLLEAEDGAITLPFRIENGAVFQPNETPDPADGGQALYRIKIDVPGAYAVKVWVDAPDDGSNSVFLRFNDQPAGVEHAWGISPTNGIEERWVRLVPWVDSEGLQHVNPADHPGRVIEQTFPLAAGDNTLIIRGREGGTRFDRIKLQRVPNAGLRQDDYRATIHR